MVFTASVLACVCAARSAPYGEDFAPYAAACAAGGVVSSYCIHVTYNQQQQHLRFQLLHTHAAHHLMRLAWLHLCVAPVHLQYR
jgi:hypothetical protein